MKRIITLVLALSFYTSISQNTFLKSSTIGTGYLSPHGSIRQNNGNNLAYFDIYNPITLQIPGGGMMSVNSVGNVLWSKFYDDCYPDDMVESGANFYGIMEPGTGSSNGITIFKCNGTNGNVLWNKFLSSTNPNYSGGPIMHSIFAEGTGIAVFMNRVNTTLTNGQTLFFVKMDANGNVTFSELMDGYVVQDIVQDANGYTLLLNDAPGTNQYVMNVDQTFTINWMKKLSFPMAGTQLRSISKADGYYISGYRTTPYEGFIIKLDFLGNPVWSRTIVLPSSNIYLIQRIFHRNGYLYGACPTPTGSGMLKFDANGNVYQYRHNSDLLNAYFEFDDTRQNADSTVFIAGGAQDVIGDYPLFIMRTQPDSFLESCSPDSLAASDSSFTYSMVNDLGVSPLTETTNTGNITVPNLVETVALSSYYSTIDSVIVQPPQCTSPCSGIGDIYVSGSNPTNTFTWYGQGGPIVSQTATSLCVGTYTAEVVDYYGCTMQSTININSAIPTAPSICMVMVDSLSLHNVILWDKTLYPTIDTFLVYREITVNNYQIVGRISKDSLSLFTDTVATQYFPNTGDPNFSSYKYKLALKDSCGNVSPMSPYHKTIKMTDQLNGNFDWNHYEVEGLPIPIPGLLSYELMRDNNLDGIYETFVGSTTSLVATDAAYLTFQNTADWRVFTNWGIACSPTVRLNAQNNAEMVVTKSRSNIKNNRITGIKNLENLNGVKVYPNPATNEITIQLTKDCNNCAMQIVNTMGQIIKSEKLSSLENKISISDLDGGIYFVKIISENKQTFLQKVVVQK